MKALLILPLTICLSGCVPPSAADIGGVMQSYGNSLSRNAPAVCDQRYMGYGNYTTTCR